MITLTGPILERLKRSGVECFSAGQMPPDMTLEPPCSLKWLAPEFSLAMGAFSYAVSGYAFHVSIGRYTSIGEQVQIGRGDHPVRWMTTSPTMYIPTPIFDVGMEFAEADQYHAFRPELVRGAEPTQLKKTTIGNDVYIGHGAFIRPGVTIGSGAVIGACAVVLKDVPPYTVVAGNPATVRRLRFPSELATRLQATAWWRFAPWQLKTVDISNPEVSIAALEALVPTLKPYEPGWLNFTQIAADAAA